MPANAGWIQASGKKDAPLCIFNQEKIGLGPLCQSYGFHVRLIHQGKDVPVGAGSQPVHGSSGLGEIIVELTPHAWPDRPLAAAHHAQRRCFVLFFCKENPVFCKASQFVFARQHSQR